ncbi:MAG: phenylalanine--tRNA ligase subunit alpha [Clostridia bacterium]|nr:phenylalanine--tRNA ligase subunit alpha [Clostridia bacterium]MDE7328711.1 phenylalanine--tRNA ligase subunit alpha [Clostridia bacterium]
MKEKIAKLIEQAKLAIEQSHTLAVINNVKVKFLGKSGELTQLLRGMKDVPQEERPMVGKYVNEARDIITKLTDEKTEQLTQAEIDEKMLKESVDITLDGKKQERGSLHPCSLVTNEIVDIFTSLGFTIAQGPEVELDKFCFQMLNIPPDHPARDMQDTFYISDEVLLRTHTSSVQARTMLKTKPPIRIVCPGKVYRPDDDATHSPMFQQIEGLVVDENVTLCDLKGLLETFAQRLFDASTKVRFRPSFFPFTEPSVEVDVSCSVCHGKGCRICKGTGWIEILGAGVVNPKVLDNCGIDSKKYKGLAFGMGIERIAMIKYGIPDMRILFENDVRFLKSFK